ncbi:MAG: alpha/beta fold hydrolase [Sulfurifustaceae bacterium]
MTIPVILIPGLLSTASLYAPQIPVLLQFGAVTVADHTRDETIEAIGQRLLDTAPERFVAVGSSMGGYVALEVAHRAPERVMKLVLLNTSARPDTPEQKAARLNQIAYVESGMFSELPDMIFPFVVHPDRHDDEALRKIVEQMAIDTGAEVFVRQQRAILARPDLRPCLRDIRCPTLVIAGEQDVLAPPDRSAEIAQAIRDSQLVVVPDCGHLSTLEQPVAMNTALHHFLQRPH